jgi:hypothetical protein
MPPNLGFILLFAKGWTGSSSATFCDKLSNSCGSDTGPADFSGMRAVFGRSGVEPLFLKEYRVRSLELALLLDVALSEEPVPFLSGDCSLWDDLDAMRFEKKDLDGSRPCFGDPGGDSAYCGIADMVGEVEPFASARCEVSVVILSFTAIFCPMLESCKNGDAGTDPGLLGDLGDVGLKVEAVNGCCPSDLDCFAALKLSDGGPFVRCIFSRVLECRWTIVLVPSDECLQSEPPFHYLV